MLGRVGSPPRLIRNTIKSFTRSFASLHNVSMEAHGKRGAFILFEGVDRTGKSTQARKLVDALQQRGVTAELWNFPDRKNTRTGAFINNYLAGKADMDARAVHLIFSANRHEKSEALVAKLLSGTTLVVDRYAYSGVAYSAAKGLDVSWCKGADAGLPAPDLVVYLHADHTVAAARPGFGEERYEKAEFQDKVRAVFALIKEQDWLVQDASKDIEQIHQEVLQEVLDVLSRCQEGEPILQLWDHKPMQLQQGQVQATQQKQQQQQGTMMGGAAVMHEGCRSPLSPSKRQQLNLQEVQLRHGW